jgi:hypothetical protein
MTQTPTSPPVGKGVYLEFVKGQKTTQVLVLPEGMTSSHKLIPMTMFRRSISPASPRKTWKMFSSTFTSSSARAQLGSTYSGPELESKIAETITNFIDPLLASLHSNGYKLIKDPIVIEVTAEDLEHARQAKTPHKAMGRVWKVRKQLGFPKEFIQEAPAPVSAPTGPAPYSLAV